MIRFILNSQTIETDLRTGSTVLDLVRYHKRLTGTKIGCREGDCGACTILVGDIEKDKMVYRSMTSCLMPLGNANGKHIVSVEGINNPLEKNGEQPLTPVQQAMVDTNGTQCGFCTIGFVMSFTGFLLDKKAKSYEQAIASIDGNICRCTGYKSIERAAAIITKLTEEKPGDDTINWLAQNKFIPPYFTGIKSRLLLLKQNLDGHEIQARPDQVKMQIGGGTDLIVQKALPVKKAFVQHLSDTSWLKGITEEGGQCIIGGSVTVTEFAESSIIQKIFPDLARYIKLSSSTPIRNMATMAGNIVNASPIGDMSIFFLALDAGLLLNDGNNTRKIKLRDLYKGYKQLDRAPNEIIEKIIFNVPKPGSFNFEKVSKRTHLDIASVNSACLLKLSADGTIEEACLSAGGVAPFPKYLSKTASFLKGKKLDEEIILEAMGLINEEIAPISDARGTEQYKRLLLRQLFFGHLQKLYPSSTEMIKNILLPA
jgi:xanthine dehydrogenase small subunit